MAGMRKTGSWGLLFLVWTLFGLMNASIVITSDWAEGRDSPVARAFLMEMTGAYTFLVLLPVLLALFRRYPITRETWWRRVPLYFLASVPFGVSHTLLMWGTRSLACPLLHLGTYDYGLMRFRFLMEYQKQLPAFWLVYAAVAGMAHLRRGRELDLQAAALKTQLSDARLNVLKMQLNPHFLFNTLNMISSFIQTDPRRADQMITRLSDFLREALRHSEVQEVTLDEELRFLRYYLDLMQARFADRLAFEVDAPAETLPALLPFLMLQPLVENAVAHGTSRQTDPGHIRITAARAGDRLRLVVADNGPGVDGDSRAANGDGVGLSNIAERLRALYGDRQRLALGDGPSGGAQVTVELPWHTQ